MEQQRQEYFKQMRLQKQREAEAKALQRREEDRLRKRLAREQESAEQTEQRRNQMRLSRALSRSQESESQREQRLADLREQKAVRIAQESDSQREQRLADLRKRKAVRIAQESDSQYQRRLADMSNCQARRLSNETIEDKQSRLSQMLKRTASCRSNESDEAREHRRQVDRQQSMQIRTDLDRPDFAEFVCASCSKLCYRVQTQFLWLEERHLGIFSQFELARDAMQCWTPLAAGNRVQLCRRCHSYLNRSKYNDLYSYLTLSYNEFNQKTCAFHRGTSNATAVSGK